MLKAVYLKASIRCSLGRPGERCSNLRQGVRVNGAHYGVGRTPGFPAFLAAGYAPNGEGKLCKPSIFKTSLCGLFTRYASTYIC